MADFEDIKKAFRQTVDNDPDVRKIYAELQDAPTYGVAMRLANKIGEDLGKVLVKYAPELSVDDLELADILPKALGLDHAQVSAACKQVQESMNKKAGLGIKYKEPQFNMDKALGLADEVRGITDEGELSQALVERIKNFSESVADDSIHDNASVIANAGVKAYIVRTAEANCCDWCEEVAGTYDYFEVKDKGNDVWRRHLGCQCDIEFVIDRGGTYSASQVRNYKK